MEIVATHVKDLVKKFYQETPFNFRQTIEEQADASMAKKVTDYYPFLDSYINRWRSIDVLDVGCGAGWFVNGLSFHHNVWPVGIDFNEVAIERAKKVWDYRKLSKHGRPPQFLVRDLFEFDVDAQTRPSGNTGKFDLVTSIGVLHHTKDCHEALRKICNDFVKPKGHIFIGLYHKYGRKPFLDEFKKLKDNGVSEQDMFERYCELSNFNGKDETFSRSWFVDQVLHPHQTLHTQEEINIILEECDMTLVESTIEGDEKRYEEIAINKLNENSYWPGFFSFIARKK